MWIIDFNLNHFKIESGLSRKEWIDKGWIFKEDPLKTLSDNGVFLPEEMFLEFQKPDTKRPKIVVYERKGKSNFKVRVVQLQLIMMAGR